MLAYQAVLTALGDETRRSIIEQLAHGPASVAEIALRLPVSRPAVSQHLRVLLEAGLVDFEQQGTRNVYRLQGAGFAALRSWLDEYWDTVLGAFAQHVHDTAAHPRRDDEKGPTP